MSKDTVISLARGAEDLEAVRQLFTEYQEWLKAPICFEDFEAEIADLEHFYAAPKGVLLIAKDGEGNVAGGVGVCEAAEGVCEMKRLFVRQDWRETHLGRRLANRTVDFAKSAGYQVLRLDTLERLNSSITLYKSMGFKEVTPEEGKEGVVYMELTLESA